MKKSLHSGRLRVIRPYVSFDYDLRRSLTAYQKKKIKKYFDKIQEILSRPGRLTIYRPRSRENRRAVARSQGLGSLTELKAVPVVLAEKPRIRVKKGDVTLETEHVVRRFIPLSAEKLVTDPQKEVDRAISTAPRAKRFSISTGGFESKVSASRGKIAELIVETQNKYGDSSTWLNGLFAYSFKNQSDYTDYKARESVARQDRDKRTSRKNRKISRARAKNK